MYLSLFGMYMIRSIIKRALRIIQKGININVTMTDHLFTVEVLVSAVGGHYVQLAEVVTRQRSRAPFAGFAWLVLFSRFFPRD
jgi:hypothetical protein